MKDDAAFHADEPHRDDPQTSRDREHASAPPGWGALPTSDLAKLAQHAETERRLIEAITQGGRYRIVERFDPPPFYHVPDGTATRRALFVDVETTGTSADARIIQFAAASFDYDPGDGRIFGVSACESWLEDPGVPIPPEITELTGISDADVAGKRIDDARVEALAADTVLVIAHNAAFDRPLVEGRFPVFTSKHWACSCNEVAWDEEGLQGRKLEWLAYRLCGMFYEAHRADVDVTMGIHLLAQLLPRSRRLAMAALLEAARAKTARVWAVETPIASKELLKGRGYRWCNGDDGRPRAWYRDVVLGELLAETTWLATSGVYPGGPRHLVQLLDARTRHSSRVDAAPLKPYREVLAGGAG